MQMAAPRQPPICGKCFNSGHSKYNCPVNRVPADAGPTGKPSVNMCYNCGMDGHMREVCPNPLNPPEVQATFMKMGMKAKRQQGLMPGRTRIEEEKRRQREQWQIEGKNIPLRLIQNELEDVFNLLNRFKSRTLDLRYYRSGITSVIDRGDEVAAADAELRSFLPRIKEILNMAKGRRYLLNYLEVDILNSYIESIDELRTELVDFMMPETKAPAVLFWSDPTN